MPGILGHLSLHLSAPAPALLLLKSFVTIDSSAISMENEGKGLPRVTALTGAKRSFACSVVTAPPGACMRFAPRGCSVALFSCRGRSSDLCLVEQELYSSGSPSSLLLLAELIPRRILLALDRCSEGLLDDLVLSLCLP